MGSSDERGDTVRNVISGTVEGPVIQARTVIQIGTRDVRDEPLPRDIDADVPHFTDRRKEQAALDELVAESSRRACLAVIHGSPGIGKTALMRHWSQRAAGEFDGVLRADLNAFGPGLPETAGAVLRSWLEVLRVPAVLIPESFEGRVARFRTALDGRRVLLLVDNVGTPDEIRALRATTPGSLTIATTRRRFGSLITHDGAKLMMLRELGPGSSLELLSALVGDERLRKAPDAVLRLVELCEGVPLLLCVTADQILSAPEASLESMIDRVGGGDQLGEWSSSDDERLAVRRVLSWSYHNLDDQGRKVFAKVGLHPTAAMSLGAVAALLGVELPTGRAALGRLAQSSLIDLETGSERYRQHSALHAYATERAASDLDREEAERAIEAMLAWYLHTADNADRVIAPQRPREDLSDITAPRASLTFPDRESAVSWCETERSNLRAVVNEAARLGLHSIAWRIPTSLWNFFYLRKHWDDWISMHEVGLASTRCLGDTDAEAAILNNLGGALRQTHQLSRAVECYEAALVIRRVLPSPDDQRGLAGTLNDLAETFRSLGRPAESLAYYEEALAISRRRQDRWGEGIFLNNLGEAYCDLGQFERAIELLEEALGIAREVDHRYGEAWRINDLGEAHFGLGRLAEANRYLLKALDLRQELGDEYGEAWTLHRLGEVSVAQDELEVSLDYFERAEKIRARLGDRWGTGKTLARLGSSLLQLGWTDAARAHWTEARELLAEVDDPEAATLTDRLS